MFRAWLKDHTCTLSGNQDQHWKIKQPTLSHAWRRFNQQEPQYCLKRETILLPLDFTQVVIREIHPVAKCINDGTSS